MPTTSVADRTTPGGAPTVVDLFSGCGGMSWGLHLAGFDVRAAVDEWPRALETFSINHPSAFTYDGDIRLLDPARVLADIGLGPGQLDVLIGGPPCQGFSKNVVARHRFLDDPRNQLYKEFLRFVREMAPRVVVMENVAELYNAYSGSVREEIVASLSEMGYSSSAAVLTAADYGVPQRRRRCFIVASRGDESPRFPQPSHVRDAGSLLSMEEAYVSAWDAISDLPSLDAGSTGTSHEVTPRNDYQTWVRNGAREFCNHFAKKMSPIQQARYDALEPGQGIKDLPDHLRPKSGYSGAYGRLDFESIAPTITRWVFHSGSGRFGHPKQRRLITMREAARIQSFTDDFKFLGSRNEVAGQIGNAVPPLLMHALAPEILRLIDRARSGGLPAAGALTSPDASVAR